LDLGGWEATSASSTWRTCSARALPSAAALRSTLASSEPGSRTVRMFGIHIRIHPATTEIKRVFENPGLAGNTRGARVHGPQGAGNFGEWGGEMVQWCLFNFALGISRNNSELPGIAQSGGERGDGPGWVGVWVGVGVPSWSRHSVTLCILPRDFERRAVTKGGTRRHNPAHSGLKRSDGRVGGDYGRSATR